MSRLSRPSALLAGAAATALATAAAAGAPAHRFHAEDVLGASLDVTAVTADPVAAQAAADAALAEIARLEPLLSGWRADGALARLNRDALREGAPAELREVIAAAEAWRSATGGAFDPRLGEVTAARRAGDAPRLERARAALQAAGDVPVLEGAAVRRPNGVGLDLDGIAKGYVIDRALLAARLAAPGVQGLMVDLGGDLRCDGHGPDGGTWRVGVGARGDGPPAVVLRVTDRAVAASGAGERDVGGASHLLAADGSPAPRLASAVVTAPCAADADALATALCLMPPREGLALVERLPGIEARLTDGVGAVHVSRGWTAMTEPAPRLIRAAAVVPAGAPEVTVAYEVPKISAPKYYAPYVVIWVTDADRKLVRTLALLGEKPRYLESNYVWWRRYGRLTPGIDAQAKPTRPPGRYTAVWDGRDEHGAAVVPGRYTVHVEAARQDGGHTYETLDVALGAGGAATVAAAPAKDELGALKVTVGRAQDAART